MRGNGEYKHRQRPHQQRQSSPPRREMINNELDEHTMRIKELLKADISVLEEENALLKTKCKKLNELQEKVEFVLRQNNQLLGENEKMSRLLHQNKSENEMLKGKLDSMNNQRLDSLSEFEYKEKRLLGEIENLNAEVRELEGVKNMQMNDLKAQFQSDIQSLKKQHGSAIDVYEQQIRKLKEILDRREYDIEEQSNKLNRILSEQQYENMKNKEQVEKLLNQINYLEADHRKDIENLKNRLQANYLEEIEQIKRNHLATLEAAERENNKLKDLVVQVESENQKLKAEIDSLEKNYQSSISSMKRENDSLKLQLIQLEKICENEKNYLEDKLNQAHEDEIKEIKLISNEHLNKLQDEIIALENTSAGKSSEIEQLLREKATARNLFDNEVSRLKQDIHLQKQKAADMESVYEKKIDSLERKLQEREQQNDRLDALNADMRDNYEAEVNALKTLLQQKKLESEQEERAHQQEIQNAKEKENKITNEKQAFKDHLKREEKQRKIEVDNLKNELQTQEKDLRAKLEALISKVNFIERENQGLKKNIQLKDKENKNLKQRLKQCEERIQSLEDELSDSRQKLLKRDKKGNELLEEQRKRLEKSHALAFENLQSDHEAALRLEAAKSRELRDKLNNKDKELEGLLKMYKKMKDEVKVLTQQEANKKNIDLKFPGATADLIATKNMFDVFLKTKVLEVCGDALQQDKENMIEQ